VLKKKLAYHTASFFFAGPGCFKICASSAALRKFLRFFTIATVLVRISDAACSLAWLETRMEYARQAWSSNLWK
jgi:hypothetical protein